MTKNTLFLLEQDFPSEAGQSQFCPDCMLLEGVIASFGAKLSDIEVVHVPFAKPRAKLVAMVGEVDQSCPALVRQNSDGERTLINDPVEILKILNADYGIPAARGMV